MVPLLTKNNDKITSTNAVNTNGAKQYAFTQYPRRVKNASKPWKSNDPIHVDRSTFTHMGYSVRTADYRYTEWVRWNQSALRPIWGEVDGVEFYDHRGIASYPIDFNNAENVNQANQSEFNGTIKQLAAALRSHF